MLAPTATESDLESAIQGFGRDIFGLIGQTQPSTFNKNFWSGRIMEWSMKQPEFKVNMFRLVDVLPTLRSSESVAKHLVEYLGAHGFLGRFLRWGMSANSSSLRAKFAAFVINRAVTEMASQFIVGNDPKEAISGLRRIRRKGLAFTVDLLGEFSVSEREATAYLERYLEALDVIGQSVETWGKERRALVQNHPGDTTPLCLSVKLSGLYSQAYTLNMERSVQILSERLSTIVQKAKRYGGTLYIDAEDTASNQIIYKVFKNVFGSSQFKDYALPGMVLQAYTKDSEQILHELIEFAKKRAAPIAIRLVKGAYWDHETISAKQNNWPSPLYAFKQSSDANYEKLSRILIDNADLVLPAFGSHNVRSLSHACCYARQKGLGQDKFELQMLYGMAEPIAKAFAQQGYFVRLYAPVGAMIPGMGYLVRRLLENTSNESFLRHTFAERDQIDKLLIKPEFKE